VAVAAQGVLMTDNLRFKLSIKKAIRRLVELGLKAKK
jgi:hypothetical protein